MNVVSRWKTYLLERSPPAALCVIGAGISIAPMAVLHRFYPRIFVEGVILCYLLLVQMRLGDEIKDLDKDRKIHPERPLPRGLLRVDEVVLAMRLVMAALIVAGAVYVAKGQVLGGGLLAGSAVFAWLMYREFFIGASLAREPMLYALSHQIIVFAVYGWVGGLYGQYFFTIPKFLGWLTYNFCASFLFEICRKLDPKASPEAGTYLAHYGPIPTFVFCAIFLALSVFAGNWSGDLVWLAPAQALMFLALILIVAKPEKYKSVEGMSILFATWLLWVPAIRWAIQSWRHS